MNKVKGSNFTDFIKYVLVRGLSSVITVSLFGLFYRRLSENDVENALTFSLIFGFFAFLSKTLPNFSARIDPSQTPTEKSKAVLVGYKSALQAQLVLAPAFLYASLELTDNVAISLTAVSALVFSSFDFDLSRAASQEPMRFPLIFLMGSAVALAYFYSCSNPKDFHAYVTVLIQWIPVSAYSMIQLIRLGVTKVMVIRVPAGHTISVFLLVAFDGYILNLPMMPFVEMHTESRIDLAVMIRTFTSSMFVLPFLLFLTNKASLKRSDMRFKYRTGLLFFGVSVSAFLSFVVYIFYFSFVSGKSLEISIVTIVTPLILSFSAYYSNSRFLKFSSHTSSILSLMIVLISFTSTVYVLLSSPNAEQTITIQATAFIALAFGIFTIQSFANRGQKST